MGVKRAGGVQTAVAEEFGEQLRNFQELMFPAAYGEASREWTHLVLTKVSTCLCRSQPCGCVSPEANLLVGICNKLGLSACTALPVQLHIGLTDQQGAVQI